MNINREEVLRILRECHTHIDQGYCQHGCVHSLEKAICQIENINEAPGMDSALRKAQEKNWGAMENHDRARGTICCAVWRMPNGGAKRCDVPACKLYVSAERQHFAFCERCFELNKEFTIDGQCYVEPR